MKKLIILSVLISSVACFADEKNVASSPGGRFQLIQLSNFRRDQFLIDTKTGKIWNKQCLVSTSEDCEYSAFMSMDVEDITVPAKEILKRARNVREVTNQKE